VTAQAGAQGRGRKPQASAPARGSPLPAGSAFVIVFGGTIVFVAMLPASFAYIFYSSHHATVEVDARALAIRSPFYGRRIPIRELVTDQASVVDLDSVGRNWPAWRTNGIGLPGYAAGWFKTADGEKAPAFITERHRVVRIPTRRNYALLVSVSEPDAFVRTLKTAAQ
jgi:hypothetical protein